MKKFLVTGFQPFGGESVNPSFEAVRLLPDEMMGVEIVKLELPVVYYEALRVLEKAIDEVEPIGILSAGQAGSRPNMTVERTAVNVAEANIPDNNGTTLKNERVYEGAPDGYFSTLPIYDIVDNMRAAGIPAAISESAGTYLCNHAMYGGLHYTKVKGMNIPAGFIHVPFMTEQALSKTAPSLPLTMIAEGLRIAVETTLKTLL